MSLISWESKDSDTNVLIEHHKRDAVLKFYELLSLYIENETSAIDVDDDSDTEVNINTKSDEIPKIIEEAKSNDPIEIADICVMKEGLVSIENSGPIKLMMINQHIYAKIGFTSYICYYDMKTSTYRLFSHIYKYDFIFVNEVLENSRRNLEITNAVKLDLYKDPDAYKEGLINSFNSI